MTRILWEKAQAVGDTVEIRGQEYHYLSRVRRHRPGDVVELRDPDGGRFEAAVLEVGRDLARLELTRELERAPEAWPVTALTAVPKLNLMDDVIRKLNELGVAKMVPILTERSVVDPGVGRMERWRRIAAESVRQCGRRSPLEVHPAMPLAKAIESLPRGGSRLLLHPGEQSVPLGRLARDGFHGPVFIAVGPEGGFTDGEVGLFMDEGFSAVSLGPVITRIETAVVAVCAIAVALCDEI